MKITATAVSLNVADPQASADFLARHVGFTTAMQADGFVALSHPDGGPSVAYLRTGLPSFKPSHRAGSAGEGLLLAFVVDDVDAAYETVRAGAPPPSRLPRPSRGVSATASSRIPTASSCRSSRGCEQPRRGIGGTSRLRGTSRVVIRPETTAVG